MIHSINIRQAYVATRIKKALLVLGCLLCICFYSCEEAQITPANVGNHVFEILQTLDTLSKENFKKHFVSHEEIAKIFEDAGRESKKAFRRNASLRKSSLDFKIDRFYDRVKKDDMERNIVWKNIEYVDYEYKKLNINGVSFTKGYLRFSHESDTFGIQIEWLSTPQKVGLVGLIFSFL